MLVSTRTPPTAMSANARTRIHRPALPPPHQSPPNRTPMILATAFTGYCDNRSHNVLDPEFSIFYIAGDRRSSVLGGVRHGGYSRGNDAGNGLTCKVVRRHHYYGLRCNESTGNYQAISGFQLERRAAGNFTIDSTIARCPAQRRCSSLEWKLTMTWNVVNRAWISSRSCRAMTRLNATTSTSRPSAARPSGCMMRSTRRTKPKVLPVPGPAPHRMVVRSRLMSGGTWVPLTSSSHEFGMRHYGARCPRCASQRKCAKGETGERQTKAPHRGGS